MIVDTIGTIETRTQKMWRRKDDILFIQTMPVEEHSLADAMENHHIVKKLCGDDMLPTLLDLRQVGNLSREARVFYAGEEQGKYVCSLALLVDNAFSRMMGNFFIRLNKPGFPTKLFTSEEAAIKWLKSFHHMD